MLVRRLVQLYAGLALYGFSTGLLILSALGNTPWDVLHQGLSRQTGLSVGAWAIIIGALLLVLWVPLRQRLGLGTVSNVLVVGIGIDATLALLSTPDALAGRLGFVAAGVVLNGVATGMYIGARFGPGPRDGLMTGLAARGLPLRATRTAIEICVLASGWLLGGTVGIGTLAYALAIGPLAHVFLPMFDVPVDSAPPWERKDSTEDGSRRGSPATSTAPSHRSPTSGSRAGART
jgi:uncharacterized membrane protein YczE